jgi:hypothetical protein
MWCPAPLPEGERHWRKLRSDKYKPPKGCLLEFYESDSLVEADEETDVEGGDDASTDPDAGDAAKPRRRTRSAVGKQSTSAAAAAVSTVNAAEKKKKMMKRKVASPPAVVTPTIPTPRSREVESEEEEKEKDEACEELSDIKNRPVRRSESPAAKRQRELVQKMSEDALRRGLELQQTAAAAQEKMPAAIKPRVFRPKLRVPVSAR